MTPTHRWIQFFLAIVHLQMVISVLNSTSGTSPTICFASKSQVDRRILSLMVKVARGFSFARHDSLSPTPYPRSVIISPTSRLASKLIAFSFNSKLYCMCVYGLLKVYVFCCFRSKGSKGLRSSSFQQRSL